MGIARIQAFHSTNRFNTSGFWIQISQKAKKEFYIVDTESYLPASNNQMKAHLGDICIRDYSSIYPIESVKNM